jgi:hypothetical protein
MDDEVIRFEQLSLVEKESEKTCTREVYRLKAIYNDGGITFDIGANQTLHQVMRIVCSKWLNILRDGDGTIDSHPWHIQGPPLPKSKLFKYYDTESEDYEILEVFRVCLFNTYENPNKPLRAKAKLENIQRLDTGRSLTVKYDPDHPTKFEIQLVHKYYAKSGSRFPRVVPSAADELAKSFRSYKPPKLCANLNSIFPHANKAMFHRGERWVCPYPSSSSNGGFIGGEFKIFFDVLFIPCKSSCLFEALVLMDRTMKKYPEKEDYFEQKCRLAFPVKLTKAKEAKFTSYTEQPTIQHAVDNLIPNKQFDTVADCPKRNVTRINEADLEEYTNILDSMFPHCAKNYGKGRWATYRNGKVLIGEGNDMGGKERGIPKSIYAEVSYNVKSLHEFFCVCEALFQQNGVNRITCLMDS